MKRPDAHNEGIQATNVTADVLAVGRAARAEKHVTMTGGDAALTAAVSELRAAVAALQLQPQTREAIDADLARLGERGGSDSDAPDSASTLEKLVSKLTAAGVVVGSVASLAEPIAKIAGILKLAHPLF